MFALRRLLRFVRPYWWGSLTSVVLIFVLGTFRLGPAWFTKLIIDQVLTPAKAGGPPLMVVGIALQTFAHLIVPSASAFPLELIASGLHFVSVIIFALVIVQTSRRANKPEVHDRFVYAALAWFAIAAIANPFIFAAFEFPGSRERLLFNLATFNIPYRDVELVGIAVIMILGVSLRLLPQAYGLREPGKAWRDFLFWGLNAALIVGAVSFIAGMVGRNHWLLMVQWLTTIALLVIAIGTPRQYRLFSVAAKVCTPLSVLVKG